MVKINACVFLLALLPNSIRSRRHSARRNQAFQFRPTECRIDNDHDDDDATNILDFDYWYAMGTDGHVDEEELNEVQIALFESARDVVVWCFGLDTGGQRRQLTQEEISTKDHYTQMARDLGIQSISMGMDVLDEEHECPDGLATLINRTETLNCTVRMGTVRIIAHESDDMTAMALALRKGLLDAMSLGTVYREYSRDITFLSYLGDIFDDPWATGATDKGIVAVLDDDDDDGGIIIPLALGVGVPAALALLLLAYSKSRRRETATARGMAAMFGGAKDAPLVYVGTGDPPGSFHEGLYHYMRDGTRYLSTRCDECYETRKNSFYTDDNLGTIMEDEPFEDVPVSADPRKLGRSHRGMDVHKCSSATCSRCAPVTRTTTFLPSLWSPEGQAEV